MLMIIHDNLSLSHDGAKSLNSKTNDRSKEGQDRKSLELKYMEELIKDDANSGKY